jgi:hypothetical protein
MQGISKADRVFRQRPSLARLMKAARQRNVPLRRACSRPCGRLVVTPVPMRRRPPRPRTCLTVSPAAGAKLAEIAAAIDAHYAGHDFARRWDEKGLAGSRPALSPTR